MKKNNDNGLILSIIFTAVAISGSLIFFALQSGGAMSSEDLAKEIEKGIENYVAEQKAEYQAAVEEANKPKDVSGDYSDDDAFLGDDGAPVTIVEFSDFQCPYCSLFVKNTLPEIKKNYIDTGKVKLVFRDFPLSGHKNAAPAAEAAECVKEQLGNEGYFAMHDMMFGNQGNLSADDLVSYAEQVGANAKQFSECVEGGKFKSEVKNDYDDGVSVGVKGTPAFVVNGKLIEGAQPFAVFEAEIEEALSK